MNETPSQWSQIERFLICGLLHVTADLTTHTVVLYLPSGHCTDMKGAITYAQRVDPEVRYIRTVAGDVEDTTYLYSVDAWHACTGNSGMPLRAAEQASISG